MEYNTCSICGANGGRAGILISSPSKGWKEACKNCHSTRSSGNVVIYSYLSRTDEEIIKTIKILDNENKQI